MKSHSLVGAIRFFFMALFTLVAILIAIMLNSGKENMLDTMSGNILSSINHQMQEAVEHEINRPLKANAILENIFRHYDSEHISSDDIQSELMHVMNGIFLRNERLNLIQFGSVNGNYVGLSALSKQPDEQYLTVKDEGTNNALVSFTGTSRLSNISQTNAGYDMFRRPWFRLTAEDKKSHWSEVYRSQNSAHELGISFSTPAFNKKGKFIGVIASELHLKVLSRKLKSMKPYKSSQLFIIDGNNHIISSSEPIQAETSMDQHGLPKLSDFPFTAGKNAIQKMQNSPAGSVIKMETDNGNFYLSRVSLTDETGTLRWQTIIIVPEAAILNTVDFHNAIMYVVLLAIFAVGAFIFHIFLTHVTRPLADMAIKTIDLRNGDWKSTKMRYSFRELEDLESGFLHLSQTLTHNFSRLRDQIERDSATGLYTRQGLLKEDKLFQKRNLLALVHITNMKAVRNTLGQHYADKFIKEFLERAKNCLPTDVIICRDNLDKFIIVFPGINLEQDTQRYRFLMETLFSATWYNSSPGKENFTFSGNTGMVLQNITPDTIDEILKHAWIALKHAEEGGNACVHLYDDSQLQLELTNIRLHESLGGAMADDELYLVLQPIFSKQAPYSCLAGECLVRWTSTILGNIPPEDFIPVAEKSGLIIPLGNWIIEGACRELAELLRLGAPADFRLHINVSPLQLLHRGFAWHLMDTIRSNGLQYHNICIEITEKVLQQERERAIQTLDYLRRHGVSVSLDDFGSTFSGLKSLHSLPFDSIKINSEMISDSGEEEHGTVIQALAALARGFNVPMIAEGVENAAQYELLTTLGCEMIQGYYLAKPAPFSSWHYSNGLFVAEGNNVPEIV